MEIKYLGTAAAEGIPALFCKCRVCENARKVKGKEYRSRSQALVNNELLLDFGPDTFLHLLRDELPLDNLEYVLITHSHEDHLTISELAYRKEGYANIVGNPLKVYCYGKSFEMVSKMIRENQMEERMQAIEIQPYQPFFIKDYTIIALKANHDINSSPLNYLILQGEKSFLYAHDTGWMLPETLNYLMNLKRPISLISLDCTAALLTNWRDHHLSFDIFMELVNYLKAHQILDEKSQVIANHFSHNGNATYEEMKKIGEKEGVLISFDGMKVMI